MAKKSATKRTLMRAQRLSLFFFNLITLLEAEIGLPFILVVERI